VNIIFEVFIPFKLSRNPIFLKSKTPVVHLSLDGAHFYCSVKHTDLSMGNKEHKTNKPV